MLHYATFKQIPPAPFKNGERMRVVDWLLVMITDIDRYNFLVINNKFNGNAIFVID
jgi:hypothetical protein